MRQFHSDLWSEESVKLRITGAGRNMASAWSDICTFLEPDILGLKQGKKNLNFMVTDNNSIKEIQGHP